VLISDRGGQEQAATILNIDVLGGEVLKHFNLALKVHSNK
jgi:hypothetical protein